MPIGIALAVAGTAMTYSSQQAAARGARAGGHRARQVAKIEAAHMERQAGLSIAAAQRAMLEERRNARLLESRALAVSAASGAGASDPTVVNLIANIAAEGSYRSALALYEGKERSHQLQIGAEVRREGGEVQAQYGESQARAYQTASLGTLFQGGTTLYSRYAGGGGLAGGAGIDT